MGSSSRPGTSSGSSTKSGTSDKSGSSKSSGVNSQASNVQVRPIGFAGRRQAAMKKAKDGSVKNYVREVDAKGNKGEWRVAEVAPKPVPGLQLYLVRQEQAPPQRLHWTLVATDADNNEYRGTVWQVNGDPLVGQTYSKQTNKRVIGSRSFVDCTKVNKKMTTELMAKVDKAAGSVPPPNAQCDPKKLKQVGACQEWTLRVLKQLVRDGVVEEGIYNMIETTLYDDRDLANRGRLE